MKRLLSGLLAYAALASGAVQQPFGGQSAFSAYDDGLFTPFGDLSALSSTEFTTLSHPAFSRHKVRVKQSHFCDESVRCASFHCLGPTTTSSDRRVAHSHPLTRAYTGYIDIEARHLFFYFFESRRDPDTDDVIFWTNGGPGGSSSLGLFLELGAPFFNTSTTGSCAKFWLMYS